MQSLLKDLTGKRFGRLKVISRAKTRITPNGTKQTYWNVVCDCGKKLQSSSPNLRRKIKGQVSCGCYQRELRQKLGLTRTDFDDLTGRRFGIRTILKRGEKYKSSGQYSWFYKCDCGKTGYSTRIAIKSSKSCGCLNPKPNNQPKPKYSWPDYKEAYPIVRNTRSKAIKRKLDWNLSDQFVYDMIKSDCYYCGLSAVDMKHGRVGIDRIDNSLGYVESNCVPCCRYCNSAKMDLSVEDFQNKISLIYHKFIMEKKNGKSRF